MNLGWVESENFSHVVDVGAHFGEFATATQPHFPNATFWCFEPLQDAFRQLEHAARSNAAMNVINAAVSDHCGKSAIFKNSFTPSSSMLPMAELHKTEFPFTARFSVETVDVITLDSFFEQRELAGKVFLKVDVQGLELQVLKGAVALLKKVSAIVLEASFKPLYQGQSTFDDIYMFLRAEGFHYHGSLGALPSKLYPGLNLQEDSIFFRQ